jgi:Homeodomain-like domain
MIPSETITSDQTECAMHKKYLVRLADEERSPLAELTRKGKAAAYQRRHANILLKAEANGPAWTDERRAESFSVSVNPVLGVRQRLLDQGLEAALNRKKQARPSRSPLLDGAGEARLIALRGRAPPPGQGRWPLRRLADQAVALASGEAISHETVRQVLKTRR